jgi:hypothetical protein
MPELRYKQLVDRLAADIREGRLRPGNFQSNDLQIQSATSS